MISNAIRCYYIVSYDIKLKHIILYYVISDDIIQYCIIKKIYIYILYICYIAKL